MSIFLTKKQYLLLHDLDESDDDGIFHWLFPSNDQNMQANNNRYRLIDLNIFNMI